MSQQTIGQRLRDARESIPTSLYQASRETRIRVDFIEALEADNFRFVSGGTYVKGMLKAYGKWLGLDDELLGEEFESLDGVARQMPVSQVLKEPAQAAPRSRTPHWIVAAGVGASSLLLISLVGLMKPVSRVAAPPSSPSASLSSSSSVPAPIAEAIPSGVNLTITVIGKSSWVLIKADDAVSPTFEGKLFSGESRSFQASDRLEVTIGDLPQVRITLNGRDLGTPPGHPGQIGKFDFTPVFSSFARG